MVGLPTDQLWLRSDHLSLSCNSSKSANKHKVRKSPYWSISCQLWSKTFTSGRKPSVFYIVFGSVQFLDFLSFFWKLINESLFLRIKRKLKFFQSERTRQEPITRRFYLPTTLWVNPVPIFSFFEAPPTGVFAAVFIISNHKRAVVLYWQTSHTGHTKVFQ